MISAMKSRVLEDLDRRRGFGPGRLRRIACPGDGGHRELSEQGLHVGAVVAVYAEGKAYEVEFVVGAGATIALVTLDSGGVHPIQAGELLHARQRDGE